MSSEKMDQNHCCLYTDNGIGIWIYMVESVHRTVSKECIQRYLYKLHITVCPDQHNSVNKKWSKE